MSDDLVARRRRNLVKAGLDATGLYHSIRLPDGRVLPGANSLEWQLARLDSFGIAEDLRGKRVLDIGPWDGFYTFEMERRGAEVTAIDYVDLDTFRALHRAFGSRADYRRLDVYELDPRDLGMFDIVLCLGVLYHLKHPLLALEKICAVTRDVCIVDTFVVDGEQTLEGKRPPLPYVELYERDELGGQLDNWCGPTVGAVEALIRSAGFASASVLRVTGESSAVAAHRRWHDLPPETEPPPQLQALSSHANRGRSFYTRKEEYIQLWCAPSPAVSLHSVYPEVDGFGVAPMSCTSTADGLLVGLRLPPGMAPGRHEARLKIGPSLWSAPQTFWVDLPPVKTAPEILSVQDGVSWATGSVDWANDGWMTLWVAGMTPEADPGNTTVEISGIPHPPEAVYYEPGQINVRLRPLIANGAHQAAVIHRGSRSAPMTFSVKGVPPPIRGLPI